MQVLYVEDSPTLRKSVARGLRREGFVVSTAADGVEGLDQAEVYPYDVIVLDVMLPGKDGFEVLRTLRSAKNDAEVLMLTARNAIDDRVTGLDLGADDYLVKPFAFEELVARVRALVRRRFQTKETAIDLGPLRVDCVAKRAFVSGTEVVLRPREFDLLAYLARRVGKVVSRGELIDHLYDHAIDLKSNAVDSSICHLRKSLAQVDCDGFISTVPRRGYLMEVPT